MAIYTYVFDYNNVQYNFTAKSLGNDLYKVKFLNAIDREFYLPLKFIINANRSLIFLPEEPNAMYNVTCDALHFLQNLSASLKEYFVEFI